MNFSGQEMPLNLSMRCVHVMKNGIAVINGVSGDVTLYSDYTKWKIIPVRKCILCGHSQGK